MYLLHHLHMVPYLRYTTLLYMLLRLRSWIEDIESPDTWARTGLSHEVSIC
jgi:hypothetical protein